MPVGKNALKRVSNNGYSKVKTTAPDMEHSEIIKPEVKPAPKTSASKKPTAKAISPKKVALSVADNRPDGFVRVELGGELPVHLL